MSLRNASKVLLAIVADLLLLLVCYMAVRVAFYLENRSLFEPLTAGELPAMVRGALRFDFAAIAYANALWLVLLFLPLPHKEGRRWQCLLRWLFVVVNTVFLAASLADAVYYPFIKRRATASLFREFGLSDAGDIVVLELVNHWYLTILALCLAALLWKAYRTPRLAPQPRRSYYIGCVAGLMLSALAVVAGMRGGLNPEDRPLHNGNARQYVLQPAKAVLVQNTPFSIIRTASKHSYPHFDFFDEDELEAVYSPIHGGPNGPTPSGPTPGGPTPSGPTPLPLPCREGSSHHLTDGEGENDPQQVYTPLPLREGQGGGSAGGGSAGGGSVEAAGSSIAILLLESFSSEYSAQLNPWSQGEGYMPFLDSLMSEGLTFETSVANGLSSIDAQASVLAGLPMLVESVMSSQATMNAFDGLGTYLGRLGYTTAYFHGADNGSLSIDGFTRACGIQHYYGRTEYGDDSAWDHHWGIWDEPFFQFYANEMTRLKEPFCTVLFSLTSHHPFQIPEAYRDTFPEGRLPIYKCIRYTDHALRRFFETARRQPWYDHTLFVITGDHTNLQAYPEYINAYGRTRVPILFYHPTDERFRGRRAGVAQHTDILPTVLGYAGYEGRYLAFGNDLLATPPDSTWAVNYVDGLFQLIADGHLLQHDGERSVGLYDIRRDPTLRHNLLSSDAAAKRLTAMEPLLKGIIQQYTTRMNENRLTADENN